MAADPNFTPVTVGCCAGCVWPAAIVTVAGETVTIVGLLLTSETVRVALAGDGRVTANAAVCPGATLTFTGKPIAPAVWTVTVAVACTTPADVARITVDPLPTPDTGTVAVVVFCGIVTVAGTVATAGLSELKLTVRPPAGAGPESVRVRFCVAVPAIVKVAGERLSEAVT
jgi:hypothetical protein